MGRILYFDCLSGAAGDMILGALVDAGLPFPALRDALGGLALEGGGVSVERVTRGGIAAMRFRVAGEPMPDVVETAHDRHHAHAHGGGHDHVHDAGAGGGHQPHRHLPDILAMVDRCDLSPAVRDRATAMFRRLAEVEAGIHQVPVDTVHLHEVGARDAILDIVGAAFAFEWFGAARVVVSPINVGGGTVRTAHGVLPVPAPATVRLIGGAPIYGSRVEKELLTPTGALVLSTYATEYGGVPRMRILSAGYGAGDRELPGMPNVVRVLVGESDAGAPVRQVVVLECEIDDMNPQIFGVLRDRLHAAGALDVFYAAVQMKKDRPGTLVTIIAPPDRRATLAGLMFRETTTIGLRCSTVERECLDREIVTLPTPIGDLRFKVARRDGVVMNAAPEFDDLARRAGERGVPLKEAQAIAIKAWLDARR